MAETAHPGRLVRDLLLPLGAPPQKLRELAARSLGVAASAIAELRPERISLDARHTSPRRVYAVRVWLTGDSVPPEATPTLDPPPSMRPLRRGEAPIIVGTGPAGLWAAIHLVRAGQPVVLLERGGQVEARNRASHALRVRGALDPESNLCFGEGGAGTYSDGKLYTRVKDPRVREVYRDLVAFGADPSLLVDAHPHVGTNRLIKLLGRIRGWLVEAGCELRFDARVDTLLRDGAGRVRGVRLSDGEELSAPAVILATGHSARDVYETLATLGVPMARKAFAIGARVEHPQALVDAIQYGRHAGHPDLEAAAYALTAQVAGRGVYSFCMCPGGFVIPTTTEPGHLNVNGMSNSNRGSRWANSALVVTVEPADFWIERPGDLDRHGALAGVALQRHLERAAFEAGGGGYVAPSQRLTDFLALRTGDLPGRSSYRPGTAPADLRAVLGPRLADPLGRAVLRFEQKMRGFLTEEAVLIGVETTTSSPVRLVRDPDRLDSPGFEGLYPTGEGAGEAGGIVSSAIDGLKVAEAVLAELPRSRRH
ncbi:MAG: FAD-dependent oxidoreductase [Deltaproteobacteria bacterium]|nr:FAD-dependent oxidoreductase [Deltaproteobacteria bacterium]MCB9788637.1 FAD-dependent oxidoreductase [Deltaproteobacteria bacterium]